jgi:hypothetical protein
MRLTLIFGLLVCFGCSGQGKSENPDITELRDKLPTIKTPISFNSKRTIDLKSIKLWDNKILKQLRDKTYLSVYGKIFETKDFITIIGQVPSDTGSPILVTFDKNGKELGSYMVYENAMGDMGIYTSNFVTIEPNRIINFTDSTVTRKINKEGTNEIPGTDSLTVKKKKYRLLDSGKIELVR